MSAPVDRTQGGVMRRCLWLIWVLGGLLACRPSPASTLVTAAPSRFQLMIPANDFVVGRPRVPLVVFDGPDPAQGVVGLHVALFEPLGDHSTPVWEGDAVEYRDFETPYWVFYPEAAQAGVWGLRVDIRLADGSRDSQQRSLELLAQGSAPDVGSRPPAVSQPTLATQPDISRLSSAENPDPALYQMTIAEALRSGQPSVITFATPAFCQTQICAPVVDSVETVARQFQDQANFIHVEIYADFQALTIAEAVRAWGLNSEPWTFVLDADGVVQARLAGPLSPTELTAQLEQVLTAVGP